MSTQEVEWEAIGVSQTLQDERSEKIHSLFRGLDRMIYIFYVMNMSRISIKTCLR